MRHFRILLGVATLCSAFAYDARATQPIGMLNCTIGSGIGFGVSSSKQLVCTFRPEWGRPEYYVGTMRRVGVDLSMTDPSELVWSVVAVDPKARRFALAGKYTGITTELTVVAGFGANALFGDGNAISLQPISFNASFGLGLAAGEMEVILQPAPPSSIH
jgi:Protein of unknown function (DUF992)